MNKLIDFLIFIVMALLMLILDDNFTGLVSNNHHYWNHILGCKKLDKKLIYVSIQLFKLVQF